MLQQPTAHTVTLTHAPKKNAASFKQKQEEEEEICSILLNAPESGESVRSAAWIAGARPANSKRQALRWLCVALSC